MKHLLRKLRMFVRPLLVGVLVLALIGGFLLVVKPALDRRIAQLHTQRALTQAVTPSLIDPALDVQSLPSPSTQTEDHPLSCADYLAASWMNQVEPGLVEYLAFPSRVSTDVKLAAINGRLTPQFYAFTEELWRKSITPRSWATNVKIDGCVLGLQINHVQTLTIVAVVSAADARNVVSTQTFVYDVFIVLMNGSYKIAAVTPSGAIKVGGGIR